MVSWLFHRKYLPLHLKNEKFYEESYITFDECHHSRPHSGSCMALYESPGAETGEP